MQRLTHKELNSLGSVYFTKCAYRDCGGHCICCDIPDEAEHKLKEYEDLEEQGLLLKLPCKVGDTAYYVHSEYLKDIDKWVKEVDEVEVKSFIIAEKLLVYVSWYIGSDRFGKTLTPYKSLFFTKEEAEEALRKEGGFCD